MADLRRRFVSAIYATHNDSSQIRDALTRILSRLKPGDVGLNVGAGFTKLHPAILNLDIVTGTAIDCQAQAEHLPFADSVFDLILTQETLEHVRDPFLSVKEMYRVLKPNGVLYCQLPFVIGYHPGPTDFWRFSPEGIRALVEQAGFECEEVSIAVGPATGFYRIVVEFWAVLASALFGPLYYPVKGLAAVGFYPLKWLDGPMLRSAQVNRIAGGYFVIAHKNL